MKNSRLLPSIWRASLLLLLSLACQATLATEWVPAPTPITAVSTGNAGSFASMTTVNGNPAIAYFLSAPDNDLLYVRANDAQGNSWGTPVVVQSSGTVGRSAQLLVVNGNPAIAYRNSTGAGLSYIRATDANGSTWGTPVTIGGATVASISMALVAGRPAIAYQDNFVSLNYVRANDADGASWGTPQVLDSSSPNGTGNNASLAVINGNPAIGYQNQEGTGSQKYIRALDTTGATWGAAVVVDAAGAFLTGGEGDLAEVNGRPAMTYQRDNFLFYVRANDAIGANWGVPQNLAPTARFTSLKVISGFPAISYLKYDTGDLRYIRASNADGTAWNPIVEVDNSVNDVGRYSQLEVIAGNPAIAYQDVTAGDLKYVRAPNPVVVSYTVTASAGANGSLNCVSPVNGGSTTTCTATPNSGYRTASISGCSGTATGVGVNTYTTGVISANCTVTATFALITVIINELDADTPGTDTAEFIELYDGGVGSTPLDGLVLVFYNGSNDLSYLAFDLDGRSTRPNGYFVLCGDAANTLNCDLDVTPNTDLIQNGQDAVALFRADATAFPPNTAVTTTNLVDALVYDTNDGDDAGLLVLLNAGQPQVNEAATDATLNSNQRCPNGSGGARNTTTYLQAAPTPGATNACAPPGVVLTQSGGTTDVTEGGATDTYTLALSSPPAANVSIAINPGAQVTVASSPVVFTTANWATAQTVTVTAVDDLILEGAHTGTISHTVSSSDLTYNGLSVPNVVANITDNEIDPCSAVSFPYTLPNNAPATLITAITCANANGVSADTINLNGQTVTLTASFADYDGATGLPRVDTSITLRNGTITRSGSNQFRLLQVGAAGNLMVRDMSLTNGGGATYAAMGGNLNANTGSVLTLINTVVSAATVGNSFNAGGIFASGTFTMANCTVSGNTAGRGAGLALQNGPALITNSVISGNVATSILGGGAMYIVGLDVAIINSTITGNYATASGATRPGGILSDVSGANLTVQNSILWGNSNGNATDPQIVNDSSFGSNTVSNSIVQGGQFGGLNAAPLFTTPLTPSATPSTAGNFRLLDASPGIDAGANANVPADTLDVDGDTNLTEDARDLAGNPRRFDDTGVVDTGAGTAPMVDLGAFEKQTNSPPVFPMDVDYCNLQFPTSFTAAAGSASPLIYGRIFEDDNGVLTSTPGAHPSIVAQVGHGPLGSDPRGGNPAWQWIPATFNTQVGNDDEYQGTFAVPFAPPNTQRSYTYRFSVDNGANYTYCDSDGNGTNGGLGFNTASLGTLTINPGGQPAISINDVALAEGNSGVTPFSFTISLNGPSLSAVTFDIATANNTATVANGDYVSNSQTAVVIPAGQTSTTFLVLVNRDTTFEPNETFFVNLTNVTGANVGDAQGTGTIVNDDIDPCAGYTFPYTMTGNTPAELIQATNCANLNGASADTINLNGQTVALTESYTSAYGSGTGLPEITTAVVIQNGTITRSSADLFRFFIYSGSSSLTLNNITLSNGNPEWDGGAIWGMGSSTLIINNSRIIGNYGNYGGAIFIPSSGTAVITNTLLSGNRASSPGGAIRNRGNLTLNNSTIAANFTTAGTEGGGGIANNGGTVVLNNSIVHGNESSSFPATNDIRGTFTANNSLVGVNPSFVNLLDAGDTAPTTGGDYRLAAFSLAIDAGSNSLIPGGVTTDLDGNPRRADDIGVPDSGSGTAPIVDLGAYERQISSVLPVVSVTPTSLAVSEAGPSSDSFVVALNTAPLSNVTIQLTFDGQVQVDAGSGFGNSPQTVTLTPANALAGVTVNVRAVDDAIAETSPHLTTTVTSTTSSAAPAFNGLAVADVSVTITDNDTPGITVTESGGTTAVSEGGANDSYSVVLTSQPTADVGINIVFDPSQVVVNGDTDGTLSLTFTPGFWNVPIPVIVTAVDDTLVEANPHSTTIVQTASSSDPAYALINPADVTVSIAENDIQQISFDSAGSSVGEAAGTHVVNARLSITSNGTPGGTISADMTANVLLVLGSAEAGDLSLVTTQLTFPAGSAHNSILPIDLTVINDRLLEGNETATLSLQLVSGIGSVSGTHEVTLSDDEVGAIVFTAPASATDESAGTYSGAIGRLTISGSGTGPLASEASVSVAITDTAGSAGTPADYTRSTNSLVFPANAPSPVDLPVSASIANDVLIENVESFSFGFGAISGAGALSAAGTHTVSIADNDLAQVAFAPGNDSVGEGAGSFSKPVTLTLTANGVGTASLQDAIVVPVSFTEGTATEPEDFTLATTSVSFAGGSLNGAIQNATANLINDLTSEASESFDLNLSSAFVTANITLGRSTTAVQIVDNDTPGVTVTESGGTAVTEGGATDDYSIVLTSQPTADVTITLNPGTQLSATPTPLTFTTANWNVAQTVTVTAVDDDIAEGSHNGTISHTATSADAVYNGFVIASVNVTITDNDNAGVSVVESAGSTAATEGGATDSYTVVLTSEPTGDVAVILGVGAQASLSPSNLTFTAANWNVAQTVTVTATDDAVVEGPQSAAITHSTSSSDANYSGIAVAGINVEISDNDSAVVNFAPASVSQLEGSSPMAFTVTLSAPVASGVTLSLDSAFGSALATDFTPISGATVSFAASSTTPQTVNVVINNDALDEDDETFSLSLSNLVATGDVTLGAATASGTILDDDATPTLTISNESQPEGNAGTSTMTFTVNLSTVSGRDVSFSRATVDGTATVANNDYVALAPQVLTLTAGSTQLLIPVTINGDTVFEGNESFSVNLTGISNATPGTLSGTGTIEEDDQQPTTTTITSDTPDPSVVGEAYTVSVTVAAQTLSPTGTLTISDGTASCGPVTLTAGSAPNSTGTCNLISTSAGAKTLTASYTADSSAFGNSSGTASHQVNPAATSISVSGPARSRINQPTSFSFALSVNAPGSGTPTGSVTLTSGAASCTATLPATSCNLTFSALGSRSVSASYAGDANFVASSSGGTGNAQTLVFALSDLAVTKSDGIGTYSPDELLVYTVTVRNLGADAAANIRVTDIIPAGLIDVVWSCDASGGVTCPQVGGSGNLDVTIASFPVGGLLNFTFYGNADGSPQIVNTATITLPADTTIEDPVLGNNSATDLNLLDRLFQNGFEDAGVNAAAGSFRLPGTALRGALDQVAIRVYSLTDTQGEALRVHARVIDNQMQYALATRDGQGRLRLAAWRSLAGDPTLSWTARQTVNGWLLQGAELR